MRYGLAVAAWTCLLAAGLAGAAERRTFELDASGQRRQGMPLARTARGIEMLGRDGRVWSVTGAEVAQLKPVADGFQGYPTAVMKRRLQDELGSSFHIESTAHYLVALPGGVRSNWAERFEELYRSFALYFSIRGFELKQPEFQLVAIVWPDQASFLRAAAAEGGSVSPNVLGYYSPVTNRIMLYDARTRGANTAAAELRETADTIIHEATHQTAFNTGLHQRFGQAPRWVVEGLGMMFEARGVWNSRAYGRREDRINRSRLEYFRQHCAKEHQAATLQAMVSGDRIFATDPLAAYAEAWALSFYLVENQPRQYCQYLALTAARPAFQPYTQAQRVADFNSVFGENFRQLEARMLRFIADLR